MHSTAAPLCPLQRHCTITTSRAHATTGADPSSFCLGHVFGKPTKREFCYDNLHISRNAWDTNLVKVRIIILLCPVVLIRPDLPHQPWKAKRIVNSLLTPRAPC